MRRDEIEQLLPAVLQRCARPGSALGGLLEGMEAFHAPIEAALEGLDGYFDPRRAPEPFVRFLAAWLDLSHVLPITTGSASLRELVATSASLACIRGTAMGLVRTLEIATGLQGFEIQETVMGPEGRPVPFHVRIVAPGGAAVHRALVERIVESEKPAHVTYDLEFSAVPAAPR